MAENALEGVVQAPCLVAGYRGIALMHRCVLRPIPKSVGSGTVLRFKTVSLLNRFHQCFLARMSQASAAGDDRAKSCWLRSRLPNHPRLISRDVDEFRSPADMPSRQAIAGMTLRLCPSYGSAWPLNLDQARQRPQSRIGRADSERVARPGLMRPANRT
jgi:hypothetical protein